VVINEVQAQNDHTLADDLGEYDDWIELYNPSAQAVDAAGLWLSDDPQDPRQWQIPTGRPDLTTLQPRGFLLIWADGQTDQGPLHAGFKLKASGESIGLFGHSGVPLLDRVVFQSQEADQSYGRIPDGGPSWQVAAQPTPGRSNLGLGGRVVIHEILFHPYQVVHQPEDLAAEFIELLNTGAAPVDVSGWRFSRGLGGYVIPEGTVLAAGGFLVVAADVGRFGQLYLGVTGVVGGWSGKLANSGETIELVDRVGVLIDRVTYSDEGDWAVRERGPVDRGHRGWQWSDLTDGGGHSLELVNPALPNEHGQNWAASTLAGGTPGKANSVAEADSPPLILEVRHDPAIPRSSDQVCVTARVLDELATGMEVVLMYRADGEPGFAALPMADDGMHGEGLPDDGVYGAHIPQQTDHTVMEFYVQARDAAGRARTWPAQAHVDGVLQQVTNVLYQVDDSFDPQAGWVAGSQPIYYLIMTEEERAELADIGAADSDGDHLSDAQMNGTFICLDGTGMDLQYSVGLRNRGHGTRDEPPNNCHVHFPHDRPWRGRTAFNFNTRNTHAQVMGSAIHRMAGMAVPDAVPVQVRINGRNLATAGGPMYGVYVGLEAFNDQFAEVHFPDDPEGNLYTCFRLDSGADEADLSYDGDDPAAYRNRYFKANNEAEDDWTDLIHLVDVLNNAPEETYVQDVGLVIDLSQWLRYIALDSLFANNETGLNLGMGDDYFMYCGAKDPRFVLVAHDLDTVLWQGGHGQIDQSIFSVVTGVGQSGRNGVDGLKRLLSHPDVIPLYYQAFLDLIQDCFNPERLDPLFDQVVGGFASQNRMTDMKQFVRNRTAAVLAQIPQAISVTTAPDLQGDLPYTTSSQVSLAGQAHAAKTRRVTVNGEPAVWSARHATWSADEVRLMPGINRVVIQALGVDGEEVDRSSIDIWSDTGAMTIKAGGPLLADEVWTAAAGPYRVTGTITVPAGRTLTIQAGTTVFLDGDCGFVVQGCLVAQGSEYARIRLTRRPGTTDTWAGLRFDHTLQGNCLACVDIEYGDSQGLCTDVQYSRVLIDHVTWGQTDATVLELNHPTVVVRDCVFPSVGGTEPVHGKGLTGEECLIFERCTFGTATGYNDILDFAGGLRPGPILQVYDCLFLGGADDGLDLDGADAHVEGCVFTNFRSSENESSSNAVATGQDGGHASEVWAARNVFVDNDHAALLKEGGFLFAENNTLVRSGLAAIQFGEPEGTGSGLPGRGAAMTNCLFWDNASVFEDYFQEPRPAYGPNQVTVDWSVLPAAWHTLGQGNLDADPLLVGAEDLHVQPMSAARGAGAWGLDIGADVPAGAAVSGEPGPVTHRTQAVLTVGGPGITHYRYSLNQLNGPWSQETSVQVPIQLTGLQHGDAYTVYILGRNSAGRWQEQPAASRTWTVDTSYRRLVINEVLAVNESVLDHEGTFPDLVELYYDGPGPLDLSGMSMTDDPNVLGFVFPAGTRMTPGQYLVLYADSDPETSGLHLGFACSSEGEGVYLYDRSGNLLDSVEFGLQVQDLSVGRVGPDGQWRLTVPTFGQANLACPLGDPGGVRINEWLAHGEVRLADDFVEVFNPHAQPVDLGGWTLTDRILAQAGEHRIRPLTFVAGGGYALFWADDSREPGHVPFRLSSATGVIRLVDDRAKEIDKVLYGPQTTDVSQGRMPDGSTVLAFLSLPTPGTTNPLTPELFTTTVVLVGEAADKRVLVPTGPISEDWKGGGAFDDSTWSLCTGGPGGVGFERGSGYDDLITLDTESQMYGNGNNTTCYVRIPFSVDGSVLPRIDGLTLKIRCDDAFVAYLNGQEIARDNFTGTPVWNSHADGAISGDSSVEDFDAYVDLTPLLGQLKAGANVLALHAMNSSLTSSDFLIGVAVDAICVRIDNSLLFENELNLLADLRVTEVMYRAAEGNALDFVELQNVGAQVLDLSGVRFTQGIEFVFPPMMLGPGEFVVVADSLASFRARYGAAVNLAGAYSGRLSDNGEDIVLDLPEPLDVSILRFAYEDAWHPAASGGGQSLVIRDPLGPPASWSEREAWHPAAPGPGGP